MIIIGIDQGLTGAVAVLSAGGSRPSTSITPTPVIAGKRKQFDEPAMLRLLQRIMREYALPVHSQMIHAYLEAVQPMPDKPAMAAISQGRCDGLWRMALVAAGIGYTLVSPRRWQNRMLLGAEGADTKQRSIVAAKRLFPQVSLKATIRCRVDNHNIADALLIAAYGWRELTKSKTGDK